MQISRMDLVYDVKISQLGRKNLAVDLIRIKLAAAISRISRRAEKRPQI